MRSRRSRRPLHWGLLSLLALVGLLTPMLSPPATAASGLQPWTPRLVTAGGDDVNVTIRDGDDGNVTIRDGVVGLAGGLTGILGDVLGRSAERLSTGMLVLAPHRLAAQANEIAVDLDATTPPGSAVSVAARGMRDNGRWTQWVPLHQGEPAVLPVASRVVQLRLVLTAARNAAGPPGVDQLRVIPDLIEELLGGGPTPSTPPTSSTQDHTYRVFATREGLVGHTTANGTVIGPEDEFVALPSRRALSRKGTSEYAVKVCADNGRCAWAPVWDVGPWNTTDDYWNPPGVRQSWQDLPQGVPEAQAAFLHGYNGGRDQFGREVTNPAGIDLSNAVFWDVLALDGNSWVTVTFPFAGGGTFGKVGARDLSVRGGPSSQAPNVGLAAAGVPLTVQCRAESGWLKIGPDQYVPESGLTQVPQVPSC